MTTAAAEKVYLARHLGEWNGTPYAVFNPHNKPVEELPVIYGFNNGGSSGWLSGALIAQDGEVLGGHVCSHEGYMRADLGILEGSRPDRHDEFRAHYPDGYRMDFVPSADVMTHSGLDEACKRHDEKAAEKKASELPSVEK